ncbi:MFS transporter [Paenibacillus cucumis (ex Kampfer et al. 2016)]|uniref:MFS transporter n=1 Tax=Paenibacillus cucumis (ex Kampfer et al. 2016) TaxID=1776858 RepID=A0ABS7KL60_9BACL|nr:MFS transporter [Paenibacillus cucumis (ex Kampfer et al. 2016)]MBY0204874.1 MFS transporter [Paenibacillus cucumis (ex Kampfer et al. 2016)]
MFKSKISPSTFNYLILITVIVAAGISQGLLLPVLSIFLEQQGVSPGLNGLNAAALYIGSFAMTLAAERLLGVLGFKKLIVGGLILVMLPLILFPYFPDIKIWFVLRLIVGIGDSALHYAAQLWVLLVTAPEKRGRYISLYGMSYGLGFSIGPLGIKLLGYGDAVPFLVLFVGMAAVLILVLMKQPDTKPEKAEHAHFPERRFRRSFAWAWYALLPALLYGYMEAGMNSNFPVYGLRVGYDTDQIASLLPFIGIGGLFLQLPLGILSDRYGRKVILMIAGMGGGLAFMLVPLAGTNFWLTLVLLLIAGGLVGSFFSLGLAYAADILPKVLLPAANVVASFHFTIGSIVAPNLGGQLINWVSPGSMFTMLGCLYFIFGVTGLLFRRKREAEFVLK